MDFNDMPTPKGDLLTYIRKGVLWVEKQPYYIVELVKEPEVTYAMVYAVHTGTEKNPQKLAAEITTKKNVFSSRTRLGQIANQLLPLKQAVKWVPKPPLFIAPIIPNQVATLTGIKESGFFEREPDQVTSTGGERKYIRGNNTGVFIGLSSIEWDEKITIPTNSLVQTLTKYKEDMFFDLEGNNEDTGNPLSRFYKGGLP